jgi:hypothetical protein
MPNAPVPPVVIQKKRGKGCVGCGCAVLVVIAVLFVLLAIFFYRKFNAVAQVYTSTAPADIATTDGGDAVYQAVQGKLNAFARAQQQNQPATLHLNADEINTLITRDPNYAAMHGKVHVSMTGDTAEIESSLQLGTIEKAYMADRYFNSDATLGLGFTPATHAIVLDVRRLRLNGLALPPSANETLSQSLSTFLNQQLQMNAQAKDFLNHAQKIDVENGELVIESQ